MIKKYLSLIKFSHTIFAMPFAMIGFVLGLIDVKDDISEPQFIIKKLLLVVLSMVFARSAAMAFDRWLDKNFDAANPRTAIREIPSGIISANKALLFVVVNCIAFVITTWFINILCFYLSFVALFVTIPVNAFN